MITQETRTGSTWTLSGVRTSHKLSAISVGTKKITGRTRVPTRPPAQVVWARRRGTEAGAGAPAVGHRRG